MTRKIQRSYSLSNREVREAILAWLKAKNLPAPKYVGNTTDTRWLQESAGIRVEWTEEDEVEIG